MVNLDEHHDEKTFSASFKKDDGMVNSSHLNPSKQSTDSYNHDVGETEVTHAY